MPRRFRRSLTALLCGVLALLSAPVVEAQDSHWGVTSSFVPQWKSITELYDVIWDFDGLTAKGKEFRIGVVRGSDRGGDWSVTFVRNWFRTDEVFDDTFTFPIFVPSDTTLQMVTDGSVFTVPGDIEITGIKFEKFTPFVTIRDRVQIGLTYGGGIGSLSGTVIEQRFENFDPETGQQFIPTSETVVERDVKDFYVLDFVPIGSVEAAVAFILAPGLKARVTGGFNYPNTQAFSFTVNYLFGS